MKRFRFRLQKLLDLRHVTERDRARLLGDALRTAEEERRRSAEHTLRLEEAASQVTRASEGVTTAGALTNLERARQGIAAELEAATEALSKASSEVAEERARYGQAHRDRRTLERIREQRRAVWRLNASREEQRQLDELASRQVSKEETDQP